MLAVYFPIVHDHVPPWLVIVLGVLWLVGAAAAGSRRRPGFGTATGRVVDRRPGKRPTVIEFLPVENADPVRFRHRRPLAIGTHVPVSFSEADPRNASVVVEDRASRAANRVFGPVIWLIGIALVVAGVWRYVA